jgi:integrase
MSSIVTEALIRHRTGQTEERRRSAEAWMDSGLVFTTSSGRHLEPRNLNTAYGRLLAHVDVPRIRFHDLRHTCATLLLSRGVSAEWSWTSWATRRSP